MNTALVIPPGLDFAALARARDPVTRHLRVLPAPRGEFALRNGLAHAAIQADDHPIRPVQLYR